MESLLCLLRHILVGDERLLARAAQSREQTPLERDLTRFERALAVRPGPGTIVLGHILREHRTGGMVGIDVATALSRSWWWTGSSGGGKTVGCLSFVAQILRQNRTPIIVVDPKGEMAQLLRDVILPALINQQFGGKLAMDIRVVRPFDDQFVPHLRLTEPEPDVPIEIQALGIATSLAEATGAELGRRMEHVLVRLVSLAVELNEPLTAVARWLDEPQTFGMMAGRSRDASLRAYARTEFPRENRETVRALRARLATVLLLPAVREAFEAPRCFAFEECLTRGITIFDFSDPPGGLDAAVRVMGSIVVGRLTRAVLNRRLEPSSPDVVVVFDEFQELVRRFESVSFSRLLALARHKRVSLHFINQQRIQLGPDLTQIIRTNTGFECAFRCNREDAEALAHAFPVPEGLQNPGEARRAAARRMTQLPTRSFLLWVKERAFAAQFVRSPRLDFDGLRSIAAELPPEAMQQLSQGSVARPRALSAPSINNGGHPEQFDALELLRPARSPKPDGYPPLG